MKTKKILFIPLIIGIFSFSSSEKFEIMEDLLNISAFYNKHDHIKLKIEYNVYKGYNNIHPESSMIGFYEKNDSLIKQSMNNIVTFSTPHYQISVNKLEEAIFINSGIPSDLSITNVENLERNLERSNKTTFIESTGKENKGIAFYFSNPLEEYEKLEVFYNKETYFLNRIVFYKSNASYMGAEWVGVKARAEMKFSKLTPKSFDVNDFMFDNYVKVVNNELVGVGEFTNFQIIDLRTVTIK